MSEPKPYIAPARRKSAREKKTPVDGGAHGRAVYTEKGDSLSVTIHPKQIKLIIRNEG